MSKGTIKTEIQKLQRTIKKAPRIWQFHGRKVVRVRDWKYGDWTKLPDKYHLIAIWSGAIPEDWQRDYVALLEKLKDAELGKLLCYHCLIYQAQDRKKEIERIAKYWQENGGEEAKQKFYEELGEPSTSHHRKQDAMLDVEWRLYNEGDDGAQNPTCSIINSFQCPYDSEKGELIKLGSFTTRLWDHIRWYDEHWNGSHYSQPRESERIWYHIGEPSIIDVTDFDDIVKAAEDGRISKIIEEHERYDKEVTSKAWNAKISR